MFWFVFSLITVLCWGFADLFYKKSTDETDKYSYLKISVFVGTVMMIASAFVLAFSKDGHSLSHWLKGMAVYSPASLGYIASMVIGYVGLRYLEVSIISPVQNASGAFSAVAIIVFFAVTGKGAVIKDELSLLDIIGTVAIVIGVIALAVVENGQKTKPKDKAEKKRRMGASALAFPLLYCLFDTIGTSADGIILSNQNRFSLSETDVFVLYGFSFFVFSVFSYIFVSVKEKKFYNLFSVSEIKTKGVAALFEEGGQIFYVYAMAARPVFAAPMIASYCVVSVILSRHVLKERLSKAQYICIFAVIFGIILLGISEGLSEV